MTKLQIYSSSLPIDFAELDSFTVTDKTELKQFRPLGQVEPHGQLIYGGYDLAFKGAKINGDWDTIQSNNDLQLRSGSAAPRYRIVDTTTWFDGTVETWIYDNVLLYNFKSDMATSNAEIKQDMTGFAPTRISG